MGSLEPYLEWHRQRVLGIIDHRPEFWPMVEELTEELRTHGALPWRRAKTVLDALSPQRQRVRHTAAG